MAIRPYISTTETRFLYPRKQPPETPEPRNRVSFSLKTDNFNINHRNPVSFFGDKRGYILFWNSDRFSHPPQN